MKKKFTLYLVLMIIGLCAIISLIVFSYTKIKTRAMLEKHKINTLRRIKESISTLDQNILGIEKEIFSQYSNSIKQVSNEIGKYKSLSEIDDVKLREIADKYNIEEIYIIDKSGIIDKTTYKEDLNLNLFNVSSEMKTLLQNAYGKGSIYTHRALMSKYNKLNKFLYYSEKNSDYIIEISVDVKKYIRQKYGEAYLRYLFNDILEIYNEGNEYLVNVDVYDVTNYVNWSILLTDKRFNGDKTFIKAIDNSEGLTVNDKNKVKFYYVMHDLNVPGIYFGKDLLLEADYDFSGPRIYAVNVILFLVVSVIVIGAAAFFAALRIINKYFTDRILKINQNLNMVEQGIYSDDILFNESDEISQIASNINKMKKKIENRELQLRNKVIELEKMTLALRESEEKLEYDKIKTEFFANISHEFKTPLNILLSSIQLLDIYINNGTIIDESDKLKYYMKGMRQNCYRLLRLINNLIDITKIDSCYFIMEPHNQNIVALVEDIVLSTKAYAANKRIKLSLHKHVNRRVINCDSDMMERIVLNLLSNAIKFTPEDGHIDVALSEDADFIYIKVKDDGVGIPDDKIGLIFDRFRQVDKSFTRNAEGSGIGLSLVKALVEMHNGSVSVSSEYEKGSEFTVILPIEAIDEMDKYESPARWRDTKIERMKIEFSDIYS